MLAVAIDDWIVLADTSGHDFKMLTMPVGTFACTPPAALGSAVTKRPSVVV